MGLGDVHNTTVPKLSLLAPPSAGGYSSVAARNLFSPTRTESPPAATVAASPVAIKPSLFGVVLRDGAPIAYLEDPNTKRVGGYRVGDSVAGGVVQTISSEGVVINRPPRDGRMAFIKTPDGISIELLQKGEALPIAEPWASMQNTGSW